MNITDDYILPLDAFVRSFAVDRGSPYAAFLGAGASISSGVPSAEKCIWEWKRSIFLSHHPGLETQFSELSLAGVKDRIQAWLDSTGAHPPRDDPSEYGHYIEACYPIEEHRRQYFRKKLQNVQPYVGYRLLCFLAQLRIVRSVWTTNFDGLTAKAAVNAAVDPIEVGIDSAESRLPRPMRDGELLCVSLHGDYRYDLLKNTDEELQEQDRALRAAMIEAMKDTSCICLGYSGRDASVMEALLTAFTQAGTGALYWCTYRDPRPSDVVVDLVRRAREAGREAHIVPTEGFDDVMDRVARHASTDSERADVEGILSEYDDEHRLQRGVFSLPQHASGTVIKSNAFSIQCPGEVFAFNLSEWPSERVWHWLRSHSEGYMLAAVPLRGQVLALGTVDDIRAAFGDAVEGQIQRTPVQDQDYRYEDGVIVSLMVSALVKGLAKDASLRTDGRRMLWHSRSNGEAGSSDPDVRVFDAVELSIRQIGDKTCIVLTPTLYLENADGSTPEREVVQRVRFHRLSKQYNSQFNAAVNQWREQLVGKGDSYRELEFPPGTGAGFQFRISRAPMFAEIGDPKRSTSIEFKNVQPSLLQQYGVRIEEPPLLFASRDGNRTCSDSHPIRGITRNRPYDYALTQRGLDEVVQLGVICPAQEEKELHEYLHQALRSHRTESRPVYLQDYPGFQQAYGLPLGIPEPGSPGWYRCPEPNESSPEEGARSLGHAITTAVKQLQAAAAPDAVIIYIPDRWRWYRGYRTDAERFDLHDYVKAFCVQRGLASQFLNEDTLRDNDQCRVWWWLSLALYVKSMRTPWVLGGMDDDTAFVGIGYSVDVSRDRGRHVILGCSHIYSASGQGLQYRLSKIEQPTIVRGNPFMSLEDARRVGETIRHLFYESRSALPRRVVLHKRTAFRREEREGLGQGLAGVSEIDMLEVTIDRAMRYVASHVNDGVVQVDKYPVRRGTTVKLDDYAALVWVHGVTESITPGRQHYQGGRRIPTPLMLRRYAGRTPLAQLAREVMGLSKMDWNTFDMYTKLPATLQSSGEIAKIGSLFERFGSGSYDYRLFM